MGQEILDIIEAVSIEKQLEQEIVFWALEESLAAATERKIGEDTDVQVNIDRKTGDFETFQRWTVVRMPEEGEDEESAEAAGTPGDEGAHAHAHFGAETEEADDVYRSPERHYTLEEALLKDPKAELGKTYLKQIDNIEFGRIAAQAARQVMFAKLREATRKRTAEDYRNRIGTLVQGPVKRQARIKDRVFIELDSLAEAVLLRRHQLEQDDFHLNTVVHAVLSEIEETPRGPQLILSRTAPEMVVALLRREVPEVAEQVVEIKAIAREAGGCTKIAVASRDARIDPVGACVGIGGVRVKQIMQELQNERIDIFEWDDDLVGLAIKAMGPAKPIRVHTDERRQALSFVVPEAQLARAIGRNGQNVRLASKLTGWAINVLSEEEEKEQQENQQQQEILEMTQQLDISEEIAKTLLDANLNSLEDLALAEPEQIAELPGMDADLAERIIDKASDLALSEVVLAGDQDSGPLDRELLEVAGMDPDLAYKLAQAGMSTRQQLADADIDEVLELAPEQDEDYIGTLIVAARSELLARARAAQSEAAAVAAAGSSES